MNKKLALLCITTFLLTITLIMTTLLTNTYLYEMASFEATYYKNSLAKTREVIVKKDADVNINDIENKLKLSAVFSGMMFSNTTLDGNIVINKKEKDTQITLVNDLMIKTFGLKADEGKMIEKTEGMPEVILSGMKFKNVKIGQKIQLNFGNSDDKATECLVVGYVQNPKILDFTKEKLNNYKSFYNGTVYLHEREEFKKMFLKEREDELIISYFNETSIDEKAKFFETLGTIGAVVEDLGLRLDIRESKYFIKTLSIKIPTLNMVFTTLATITLMLSISICHQKRKNFLLTLIPFAISILLGLAITFMLPNGMIILTYSFLSYVTVILAAAVMVAIDIIKNKFINKYGEEV